MGEQLELLDARASQWRDAPAPELVVRESRRARRLILQVVPPHTLEVVVPRGTRPRVIEVFIRDNGDWIDRARAELARRLRGDGVELPRSVLLAAVGREVAVDYDGAAVTRSRWENSGAVVRVIGATGAAHVAGRVLRDWLLHQGRAHLRPWLWREAEVVGERPGAVQVRLQRSRWGSCSAQRTISLNAALLLLEPRLVRYLMIHELCHLRAMSHSPRYWRLVERFEPDFRALDRALTAAWTALPLWIVRARSPAAGAGGA